MQRYIFAGGILIFITKCSAFFLTNSVGILSDALESTVNIITGFITLKSLQFASKPRDENHPYGHGKVELITASLEGILICVAGIMIIIEAINRLGTPSVVLKMDIGIIILVITALGNYFMGRYSIRMGTKKKSIALISGGKHLISDTYTTLALVLGLAVFYLTGQLWVDSALAIIFGCFIIYTGFNVLKSTINGLMDEADNNALADLTALLIAQRDQSWINIHKLTYLKFGHVSHVDLHLTLPWYYDMRMASEKIASLKGILRIFFPEEDVDISIQSEPCTPQMCHQCLLECPHRQFPFTNKIAWSTEQITGKNIFNTDKKN